MDSKEKMDKTVPEMSEDWVNEISDRYIELYEKKVSGDKFIKHPKLITS